MLERINRKNANIEQFLPRILVIIVVALIFVLLGTAIATGQFSSKNQPIDQTTGQPIKSASDILIASWDANQTKLNNDILSDIRATGSKIVNGTISSGTTITTTRADFLFHLSNKTVVYISPAEKIALRPTNVSPTSSETRLTNPFNYSVIVDGVTYTISANDYRYSLMKLRNHTFIDVIWINDNYWWG